MISSFRLRAATRAALIHFLWGLSVALLIGWLMLGLWYPHPYTDLSGGRELFLILLTVDVVCGPLLTAVIFSPIKQRNELWRDVGSVVLIQLAALAYGLHTVWEARPLFLVMEVDRFKVVAAPDLKGATPAELTHPLRPAWFAGPATVSVRAFKDGQERQTVLFDSLQGGRDIAKRPDFYRVYEGEAARKSWLVGRKLDLYLEKYPSQGPALAKLATEKRADPADWRYLPVVGRQDWIAIVGSDGQIQGFLQGDGF